MSNTPHGNVACTFIAGADCEVSHTPYNNGASSVSAWAALTNVSRYSVAWKDVVCCHRPRSVSHHCVASTLTTEMCLTA